MCVLLLTWCCSIIQPLETRPQHQPTPGWRQPPASQLGLVSGERPRLEPISRHGFPSSSFIHIPRQLPFLFPYCFILFLVLETLTP